MNRTNDRESQRKNNGKTSCVVGAERVLSADWELAVTFDAKLARRARSGAYRGGCGLIRRCWMYAE